MTFTCTIDDGTTLDWISEAFSGAPQTFTRFVVGDTVGQSHIYEGFTTTLTRVIPDPDMPGFGDLTSTLTFTASTDELNGTVIQCSNTITARSQVFTTLPGIFHACLLHCTMYRLLVVNTPSLESRHHVIGRERECLVYTVCACF